MAEDDLKSPTDEIQKGWVDEYKNGATWGAIVSKALRLRNGRWTPTLLGDYAASVGLELEGIKGFQQMYEEAKRTKKG